MQILLSLLFLTLTGFSIAEERTFPDHLVPERSVFEPIGNRFSSYYALVSSIHLLREPEGVVSRVFVLPSWGTEYFVAAYEADGGHRVRVQIPSIKIWGYDKREILKSGQVLVIDETGRKKDEDRIGDLDEVLPDDPRDIEVHVCDLEISDRSAAVYLSVTNQLLSEVRYPDSQRLGLDGTTYHFGAYAESGYRVGKIWSPPALSKVGRMAAVVRNLKQACFKVQSGDQSNGSALDDWWIEPLVNGG